MGQAQPHRGRIYDVSVRGAISLTGKWRVLSRE
jgi:hypothetical protein